uniref:MYND-type domain-containing protein n=1 Tax=Mycena chlorophos TaxID=658473 RepID=A0ABQ0KZQ5_MYCCL|nr:predicted protein [Mycena chlorophos]
MSVIDTTTTETPTELLVHTSTCAACGKRGPAKTCRHCRNACYCDAACQRSHWKTHRGICRTPAPSTRNGPAYQVPTDPMLVPADPPNHDNFKAWIGEWEASLIRWSLHGAHLALQAENYMLHHTYATADQPNLRLTDNRFFVFLLLRDLPGEHDPKLLYEIETAGWLDDASMRRMVLALSDQTVGPPLVQQHDAVERGVRRVRIIVGSPLEWTTFGRDWTEAVAGKYDFHNREKIGRVMAGRFRTELKQAVLHGDVDRDMSVFQQEWQQAMADLAEELGTTSFVLVGEDEYHY